MVSTQADGIVLVLLDLSCTRGPSVARVWVFSPSHCSHVVCFSLSLVNERGQVLSNGNRSVDPGNLVDEYLSWWLNTFLKKKNNLRELKRT